MKHDRLARLRTLLWLFLGGSVAGFVAEGVWHYLHHGCWESHTATLWGPFYIIYGCGAVVVFLAAQRLEGRTLLQQFCVFALAGSAVEYAGSLFQELAFGTRSWDYSAHFMDLGGRVSLKMTLLWGAAGLLAMHALLPFLLRGIAKLRLAQRTWLCRTAALLMCLNLFATCAALGRWESRQQLQPPANRVEAYLDRRWDDARMQARFPNMVFVAPDAQ